MHYITKQYDANVREASGLQPLEQKVRMSRSFVVEVASAFQNSKGLTIGEIARALAMPRSIAAERLSLLEAAGLVRSSKRWYGGIGTPSRIYRPTPALGRVVPKDANGWWGTLSFENLRGNCKFRVDDCCTICQAHPPCECSYCPFIGRSQH